jgi:hypothetical protein
MGIDSLALPLIDCIVMKFSGADARLFMQTKEIIILFRDMPRAVCEAEIVLIDEEWVWRMENIGIRTHEDARQHKYMKGYDEALTYDLYSFKMLRLLRRYVVELRVEMEKKLKQWKTYQRRRVKEGKSSLDWIVPTIRMGRVQPISETITPYSYLQQTHMGGQ